MSTIVCVSARATLTRSADGRLMCDCPYACLATYEPCQFAGPCGHDHSEPLKKQRVRRWFKVPRSARNEQD